MALIADILLVAAALGAAFYCFVLSRRLKRFNDLENGVGGAIAVLSSQVDEMTRALQSAQTATRDSSERLGAMTDKAEGVAGRLELLVASMHDLPVVDEEDDGPPPKARDPESGEGGSLFRSRRPETADA